MEYILKLIELINPAQLVAIGIMLWFLYNRLDCKIEKNTQKIDNVHKELDEKIDTKIKLLEQKLSQRIDNIEQKLSQRIDNVEQKLTQRIDNVEQKLSQRIDNVEQKLTQRIDNVYALIINLFQIKRIDDISNKQDKAA